MFRMPAFEYRLCLAEAVRFHRDRLTAGHGTLDRVYGESILARLAEDLRSRIAGPPGARNGPECVDTP
ncbi:hypothetical protein ACFTZB_20750 [Rhodococcus sp. NPDC057014]|uniref:hypothetical protein n=1 Tax=Rhodococcus sp. NPDC057014 TaxID=3346000 RepID=UPI00363CDB76